MRNFHSKPIKTILSFSFANNLMTTGTARGRPKSDSLMSEEEEFSGDDGEEVIIDGGDDDIIIDDAFETVAVAPPEPEKREDTEMKALMGRFNPKTAAARRLLSDLRCVMNGDPNELGFVAEPQGNDIFTWSVRLFGFEKGTPMYTDLQKYKKQTGRDYVEMQVSFPPDYPDRPPFIRVIQPRFAFHTGRVTVGGSLCTDVLTMESWNPSYDIQSLILNIFSEIAAGNPRIDFAHTAPYSLQDARMAYVRVAADHQWKIPNWFPDK
jgi:ubiquitin-conjugating enzyme E2 Q